MTPLPPNPPLFPYTTLFRSLTDNLFARVTGVSRHSDGYQNVVDFACAHPTLAGALQVSDPSKAHHRSEEHTSELQSHSDLVCRLLLEKKNGRAGSATSSAAP